MMWELGRVMDIVGVKDFIEVFEKRRERERERERERDSIIVFRGQI